MSENNEGRDRGVRAVHGAPARGGMAWRRRATCWNWRRTRSAWPSFLATFRCLGMVRLADGSIEEANYFQAGIWFPPDYLRRADPFEMLRWFGPPNIWHPNISDTMPLICVGRLTPGMSLVDILYQIFELITFNKFTSLENDCLNKACCSWARQHQHRFPVDRRPLKRRPLNLEVSPQ